MWNIFVDWIGTFLPPMYAVNKIDDGGINSECEYVEECNIYNNNVCGNTFLGERGNIFWWLRLLEKKKSSHL